jgi:RNA recognition motif-containing protein
MNPLYHHSFNGYPSIMFQQEPTILPLNIEHSPHYVHNKELAYYQPCDMPRAEIFVTYLFRACNSATLRLLFENHGFTIRSAKIKYDEHNTTTMCGFVSFYNKADAAHACNFLNNKCINGRIIK